MHCKKISTAKKNLHHPISQFDNRFGVTSLETTDQIQKLQNWHHRSAHYMGIDQTWLTPKKYVKTEDTRNEGHPMF